jgi:hypothetical protein
LLIEISVLACVSPSVSRLACPQRFAIQRFRPRQVSQILQKRRRRLLIEVGVSLCLLPGVSHKLQKYTCA